MTSAERRLRELFSTLVEADRQTLVAFAEFLASRAPAAPKPILEPQIEPRPAKESVVGAIKRLSRSYPMLDKAKMLNDTSALMTQHLMQGRTAVEVIDDLEALFARHYRELIATRKSADD
jgi:hypothetical protein